MSNRGRMKRNLNYPHKARDCPCGRYFSRYGMSQHRDHCHAPAGAEEALSDVMGEFLAALDQPRPVA